MCDSLHTRQGPDWCHHHAVAASLRRANRGILFTFCDASSSQVQFQILLVPSTCSDTSAACYVDKIPAWELLVQAKIQSSLCQDDNDQQFIPKLLLPLMCSRNCCTYVLMCLLYRPSRMTTASQKANCKMLKRSQIQTSSLAVSSSTPATTLHLCILWSVALCHTLSSVSFMLMCMPHLFPVATHSALCCS